ncbi:motile sperm domain-containing protein 2-like isoform X1 [Xyrauchen texanus]|uniref:motile sperm domain-containing protein 2-like isoform X1 n=1 Tax=Xyrauchen texanus TaxID=154827 RepID=UPI0022429D69|nr:motile sperm domain-containing protein 2-like isoform X1 [Xyrauchen texanus]
MAEAGLPQSEQHIGSKIEETRQRFKSEYVEESTDKYDPRDVEKLLRDDALAEAYLTWRQFVVEDTLKMIDESLQWRKEFNVNDVTESSIPRWMFESGAVYLHGYDKEGNKLFWFKVKLHVKDTKTVLDKKRYVAFWLERYAKREPGMPLTVVFDMSESGLGNIDMDFVKYIISCFRVYYPKFLSKMIMYDMPWIMNAAWKIVKTWLGPEAISKLKFVSKSDIQMYIDPEHLPPHMSGTDQFKYSYPPLPDDDFQSPICENGPVVSEDESDIKDLESESKEALESSFNSEQTIKPKKVNFQEDSLKSEDLDRSDGSVRLRAARKPTSTFKGTLIHISPAEELSFGAKETEKKCLIILNNVSKNHVAFKVRTTAPEKYRVKPSNSNCEPGASVDIVVSLHGGFQASPQDRFLVMAAEMEASAGAAIPDLAQFWKEVSKSKIMEQRLRCHILESPKLIHSNSFESPSVTPTNEHQDLQTMLMRVMMANSRLEQKLESCLWVQKVLVVLVSFLLAFNLITVYSLWTS